MLMFQKTDCKCFWTVSRAYTDGQTVCEGLSIPWGNSESAFPVLCIIAPSIGKMRAKKGIRQKEGEWWRRKEKRGTGRKRDWSIRTVILSEVVLFAEVFSRQSKAGSLVWNCISHDAKSRQQLCREAIAQTWTYCPLINIGDSPF